MTRARLAALILALVAGLGVRAASAHLPVAEPAEVFADGLLAPSGLVFTTDGRLLVAQANGEIIAFLPDGSRTPFATLPDPLISIMVLRDKRILVTSTDADRIWALDPVTAAATIFASGIGGPAYVAETRRNRIFVTCKTAGTLVELTDGTPVVRLSSLDAPTGLAAWTPYVYVAQQGAGIVSRHLIQKDGGIGPAIFFGHDLMAPQGVTFDRPGNLLVTGGGKLRLVKTHDPHPVLTFTDDPLIVWPSSVAYGAGQGFRTRDIYVVNRGEHDDGTRIVKFHTNHTGKRLIN